MKVRELQQWLYQHPTEAEVSFSPNRITVKCGLYKAARVLKPKRTRTKGERVE